jgi:hypothetical protein
MARRLGELPRRERIRKVVLAAARILAVWGLLFAAYNLIPLDEISGSQPFLLVGFVITVFAGVVTWTTFRVLAADLPQLRAVEALGFTIPFFLILFAVVYLVIQRQRPLSFSEPLDHVSALYFSITLFATVGFGDITPTEATTRMVVSLQMLLDLIVLGVVVKVIFGAARMGIQASDKESSRE